MMKIVLTGISVALALGVSAAIKVSDVEVFSGYPWKEIVVGYTITGTDSSADYIRLTATDKSANKSYTAKTLLGIKLTEGRHALRWNAAAEGVQLSSTNVAFQLSVVNLGVQLWENGPYWAECNVGATKPEEYGYYFWWGDTVGYTRSGGTRKDYEYSGVTWVSSTGTRMSSSPFSPSSCPTYNKNNSTLQSQGYIDSTGNLVAKYDTATAHFGAPWRMPTDAEFLALTNNCTTTWTRRNGVYGRLVTGKGAYASKSIFLPAAGIGNDSRFYNFSSSGYYWSSTPSFSHTWQLYFFDTVEFGRFTAYRYYGQSVRPVRGFDQ